MMPELSVNARGMLKFVQEYNLGLEFVLFTAKAQLFLGLGRTHGSIVYVIVRSCVLKVMRLR
jgi:hypothetical protein